MTISFNDDKSSQRVADLRQQEEEDLAQLLAQRYEIQYVDLSGVTINTDALKLVPQEVAQKAKVAIFDMTGKK